jgi:HK97 family phage major capsid protein
MKLKQLQEKRGSLVKQAREILDAANTESRALTADEQTKLAGIEGDIDNLAKTIDAEMRQIERESQSGPTLSRDEQRTVQQFSLSRALACLLRGQALDGIEGEMHAEGVKEARQSGVAAEGNLILPRVALFAERRDMTATLQTNNAGDQGGDTVPVATGSIIGLLYAKSVLRSLGARFLTGLSGNITFPKLATGSAGYHTAETTAPTESNPTTSAITLSPNKLGTYVEISKQLLLQSNEDVEAMIRSDIGTALALAMENGALNGTGANNQPLGLLHADSGIDFTSVVGGAAGLAPNWGHIVGLETAVATLNADINNLGYLTNPKVRGKLKTTSKAGTEAMFVWENGSTPLNGYKAEVTTQVPSNLDKGGSTGVCSAILFGNFDDLIVAMWGGLDITVNPYIKDIDGLVRITANTFYDTAIRRTASFAAMKDALTA